MRTNTQRAIAFVLMLTGFSIMICEVAGELLGLSAGGYSFKYTVLSTGLFVSGFIADILISISEKLSLTTYNIRTENVNLIEDKPND